jgi:hypothetical protein
MIWEQRKRGVTFREMGWVVHHGRGQCEEYDKEEEREMSTVGVNVTLSGPDAREDGYGTSSICLMGYQNWS